MPDRSLPVSLVLEDEEQARDFGLRLGAALQPGMTLLLEGPVGAGKSHIARSAIRAMAGAMIDVPSPTFTLVQSYDTPKAEVWHADLYRLTDPGEIEELGLADAMGRDIVLIEWPDRLGSYRPSDGITLTLSDHGEGRLLRIQGAGASFLAALGLAAS